MPNGDNQDPEKVNQGSENQKNDKQDMQKKAADKRSDFAGGIKDSQKDTAKEQRDEFKQDIKDAKSEPEAAPINPFATDPAATFTNGEKAQPEEKLPTKDYEERYESEAKKPEVSEMEQKEVSKMEKPQVGALKKVEDSPQSAEPVNPFVSEPTFDKPMEDKPLDEKPLDKDKNVTAPSKAPGAETVEKRDQDPEEVKQSEEKAAVEGEVIQPQEDGFLSEMEEITSDTEADIPMPEDGIKKDMSESQPESEGKGFKEEAIDILEQAGFTKGRLIGIGIGLLVLIFLLFFIFAGWYKIFIFWDGGDESPEVEVSLEQVPEAGDSEGVVSSYVIGLEHEPEGIEAVPIGEWGSVAGVRGGFAIGDTLMENSAFGFYIDTLRRMQNIYDIDVYALIDQAVDRRAALEQHLSEMEALIEEALDSYHNIETRIETLSNKFSEVVAQKDLEEDAFFQDLEALRGESANDNLNSFIDLSKESSEIKAYHSAYKSLREMFVNSINALRPRYEDISANKEAIIKGIHVFDVPDSDINAIIRLND